MFGKHCVSVVVADDRDKRDSVEAVGFTPATYDCPSQDGDDSVMLVINVDLIASEYVVYPASTNLAVLIRDNLVMPG